MKLFNWVFILLFVAAAALQYNDPDPYLWIPIYLYGVFLCLRAAFNKFDPGLLRMGIVFYGSYAGFLFVKKNGVLSWIREHSAESVTSTMQAAQPWIESTREFGGLIILLAVLATNYFWLRTKAAAPGV